MVDPTLGAVSSFAGLFAGFVQHFKPSRSPYLLGGMLCAASLLYLASTALNFYSFLLFVVLPIGWIYIFLSILCFFFKPYSEAAIADPATAADLTKEIDEQFKFSRTLCLSAGIAMLSYLVFKAVEGLNANVATVFFVVGYAVCIGHILTFLIFIYYRNIEEERLLRVSLFQITFFTCSALIGLVLSGARVVNTQHPFLECTYAVQYEKPDGTPVKKGPKTGECNSERFIKDVQTIETEMQEDQARKVTGGEVRGISKNKMLFWYFLCIWAAFEMFWLSELKNVIRSSEAVKASG